MSSKLVLAPDRANASFAPHPEYARDSAAHPCGAFAERVVNASQACQKILATGDSPRLSNCTGGDSLRFIEVVAVRQYRLRTYGNSHRAGQGGRQWCKYLGRPQQQKKFCPA